MAEHEQHRENPEPSRGPHGPHRAHGRHGGGSHEEHEGAPEWLISFADNVALMMGFFVILLAMNMKDPKSGGADGKEPSGEGPPPALLDSVIAIREAFNSPVDMDSLDPADQALIRRIREIRAAGRSRQPGDAGEGREAQAIRPTVYTSLGGTVPFEDGRTSLDERGEGVSRAIGQRLRGLRWVIEVRGHAAAWESARDPRLALRLGHERAAAVAEVLVGQGLPWEQVRLVSCGDHERVVGRSYEREEDRSNQRVEVVVTEELLPESPYTHETRPSGRRDEPGGDRPGGGG